MAKLIKCKSCGAKLGGDDVCVFAVHRVVIDGIEHVACCPGSARRANKKKVPNIGGKKRR